MNEKLPNAFLHITSPNVASFQSSSLKYVNYLNNIFSSLECKSKWSPKIKCLTLKFSKSQQQSNWTKPVPWHRQGMPVVGSQEHGHTWGWARLLGWEVSLNHTRPSLLCSLAWKLSNFLAYPTHLKGSSKCSKVLSPTLRVSDSESLGGARESAFLTSPQRGPVAASLGTPLGEPLL